MSAPRLSHPMRAAAAGAVCLAVLTSMMLLHAWPLWTGRVISMPVTLTQGRDAFRGERVDIGLAGARIAIDNAAKTDTAKPAIVLPSKGPLWDRLPPDAAGRRRALVARVVYLQLVPEAGSSHYRPVSISDTPDAGAVNLKGRIRRVDSTGIIEVDYGLDAYFVQEGEAQQLQQSLKAGGQAEILVAIASSGRARIKALVVNGTSM